MRNSKLVSRVLGGVGNQLFIYASSKSLALKNNFFLKIEIKTGFLKDSYKRAYKLNSFNITAKEASWGESFFFVLRKRFPLIKSVFYPNAKTIREPLSSQYYSEIFAQKIIGPTYMEGYWQSPLYFEEVEHQIRSDLTFKNHIIEKNKKTVEELRNRNSIAIHVRRIAYSNKLSSNYYKEAIDFLKNKISAPFFYIFSDDITWCKENLEIESPVHYVENNDEITDLYLMTQCKHFVIANSSFSWWGAWLSRHKNKIVIAPAHPGASFGNKFYPKDWLLIDNNQYK